MARTQQHYEFVALSIASESPCLNIRQRHGVYSYDFATPSGLGGPFWTPRSGLWIGIIASNCSCERWPAVIPFNRSFPVNRRPSHRRFRLPERGTALTWAWDCAHISNWAQICDLPATTPLWPCLSSSIFSASSIRLLSVFPLAAFFRFPFIPTSVYLSVVFSILFSCVLAFQSSLHLSVRWVFQLFFFFMRHRFPIILTSVCLFGFLSCLFVSHSFLYLSVFSVFYLFFFHTSSFPTHPYICLSNGLSICFFFHASWLSLPFSIRYFFNAFSFSVQFSLWFFLFSCFFGFCSAHGKHS